MSNPTKEQKLKSAYEYWQKNPHILVDDLVRTFKTNRRDLSDFLKANSLGRPDGRVIGKGSPRQQAIKASYEAALKARHHSCPSKDQTKHTVVKASYNKCNR